MPIATVCDEGNGSPVRAEDGERQSDEGNMPLKMRVHDREPIGLALRRFKKLLERSGIQKELRKRKYYEKPCEARRRAELRKQSAIRKAKNQAAKGKA
jgi:small subunit ribosomal protein S21